VIDVIGVVVVTVGAIGLTTHEVFVYVPDIVPAVHVLVCEVHELGKVTDAVEYAVLEYPVTTLPHGVPVHPGVQEVFV